MGLNEGDRKELVKFRLEQAKETLAEIHVQMENKFYRTAANRLYYACFYAATALLVKNEYEAHTHNGVKKLLNLHFIKENKIDKSFSEMYGQLFNLRHTGDYGERFDVKETDVLPLVEPAKNFIATIEKLLTEN